MKTICLFFILVSSSLFCGMSGFDDVLLVIHYNHPYYETKDFIKKIYSPHFKNIVFYGEQPHPEVNVVPTHIGYLLPRVVSDVLTRYPNYRGYLFLQDDCILNSWNCKKLNKDKIWFGLLLQNSCEQSLKPGDRFVKAKLPMMPSGPNQWWWWDQPFCFNEAKAAYWRLPKEERDMLAKNIGREIIPSKVSDMFYLPGKYRKKAIRDCKILENVFLEISIPMLLLGLDDINHWEHLKFYWGSCELAKSNYNKSLHWVHNIKLSDPANRAFVEKMLLY